MCIRYLLSILALAATVIPDTHAASAPVANRSPLQANAFNALPLGSVTPKGWLLEQLRLQAQGLSGHLDEFWPDLGPQSAWLGGTGEGWERGPYFLDGLVPLAYLTKDATLLAKVKKWMDWVLEHQQPDGAIGPVKNLDWWPNYVMLKALMQYQEASGDPRVIPLMEKYFAYQARHMDERPLKEWAIFRWHDEVLSVLWLYNRNGDRALLDLARKLHAQGHDWEAQFADFKTKEKVTRAASNLSTHGVNNAMAMKAAAVWWLVTGEKGDRASLYQMFDALDRYHGQPSGIFSSDEHYAGRDPSQGTELCAVVEAMFSLETDMAILGDAAFGDRLEKIAYNALPATLSADLWAHQYDQQANQVMCCHLQPAMGHQRSGEQHFRAGAEFRLLHGEHASGLAEAGGEPVDGDAGWRARGGGVRSQRSDQRRSHHRGAYRLSVSRERHAAGEGRQASGISTGAAHSGVGRDGLRHGERPACGSGEGGRVPAHRTRMEECGSCGAAFPNGRAHLDVVQQFDGGGARAAGVLVEDWGKLAQDQADRSGGGLGSVPDYTVELCAGERRVSGDGESDGATAVYRGRGAGGDHGEGAPLAPMDARGRFAGRTAGESGDHQARGGDGDAGPVWRRETADYGVPVVRVEDAGKSSPQMYLLNQS